nr:retrovirus-related Pol polyprotein from transposon TNT 1-94 [Tanacetum cinerariifolium]
VIDMKKDPETPLLIGRGFLETTNAVIYCRKAKIAVGEGITRSVFRVKGIKVGQEEAPYWIALGKKESYKPWPSSDGVGIRTPYYARKDFLDLRQMINHKDFQKCLFACFVSQVEPKKVIQALTYPSWIEAMHDEPLQFKLQIEAIRLFLACASFKDFIVYQMDVKSAFLYGKIEEEVYVCQPLGFEDLEFPDIVYKVEKALYGLHQAPRSWYETLSTYLLDDEIHRGQRDKTLYIKSVKGDIILVQISYMRELTFFLGLQVTQKDDGIFISQDKYVHEILKKFGFLAVKTTSTPMETSKPLLKDENAKDVDVHLYRSMIGSLMYLTLSRPDIMFDVCACARFQATPIVSHLHAMKRIFRYLKGQPALGL